VCLTVELDRQPDKLLANLKNLMVSFTIRCKKDPIYQNGPPKNWGAWRRRRSNRLNPADNIGQVIHLTEIECKALQALSNLFRADITPYFISLLDPKAPNDPIHKQLIDINFGRGFSFCCKDERFSSGRPSFARCGLDPSLSRTISEISWNATCSIGFEMNYALGP